MAAQHIPAWKRLGLKLKYSNEDTPTNGLSLESDGGGRKRRMQDSVDTTNDLDGQQHRPKKSRVEPETYQKQLNDEANNMTPRTPKTAGPKRKKSVTFATDTKIADGETAQTIQFWVPGSPGSTPLKQSGEVSVAEPAESAEPLVKRKKEKKPKDQRKTSTSPTVARKGTAALEYLDQFYHQRTSWKFNKNHEVWLLKHALSNEQVPLTHNLALASYIHGLKSAGARQRLVEQSRHASKTTAMSAQEEADMRNKVLHVLDSNHDQYNGDEKQKLWFEDQDRAQLLLFSLNERLQQPGRSMQPNGQTLPRAKKNKSRTARIEVDSSSSSESESESDGEAGSDAALISKAQNGLASKRSDGTVVEPSDDTSSDASSDSSTEDDTEDDEESSGSSDSD